jgi:hypothetical protein
MSSYELHTETLDVDELWLQEWAARGIAMIERTLANHAAFEDYLRIRPDLESGDGDRRRDA